MGAPRLSGDRTLRSRFECKYLVSEAMAGEMRDYARPYLGLDPYCEPAPDHAYAIFSLYLDSPRHELYATTVRGIKNRFKLRIRGYDADPASPLFAEVKRRVDRTILKRRARIDRETACALLRGTPLPASAAPSSPDLVEFRSLATQLGASPAVYVSYRREAYEAYGAEPVRMTFDRELRNAPADPVAPFDFDRKDWRPTPCGQVILELKYTDACPAWVPGIVSTFQLDRCSVAKYVMCLDEHLARARRPHG